MKKERFKIIPAVYMILCRGNDVFLMRRANTGFHDGEFSFPAGHLNGKETLAAAAIRETLEEAGVTVKSEDMTLVHIESRNATDGERVGFFFKTEKWSGEPQIMEHDKCDSAAWFRVDSLPKNTISYIRDVIGFISSGQMYSEFGW